MAKTTCTHGLRGPHQVNLSCPGGAAAVKCSHGHVNAHEFTHIVHNLEVVHACNGGTPAGTCQHGQTGRHNAPWQCSGP